MKRILFVCCLLTATCAIPTQKVFAQTTVTVADFTAKVNLMDTYIGAGNMTQAQTTWTEIHNMMLAELGITKSNIAGAANATIAASYMTTIQTQQTLYGEIWALKPDLTLNRVALHTKLLAFAATF
ncbi:hypothetical protein CJD36_011375 [Flavipsychrobacter stenotrophus]|uniref:Uncharacterized protein n=1 Tax=Flavipsychrobacter stenotrophus TaxID=2077091 RepID=A0A2S7SV25_9BACT|nr:hypothetical protein [Flavipsychrobacter stenotrophus]PQJ10568.1 hypothetical protein CJD36_011375 [Flavipsychrobacter stenotrophus]